MSNIKSITPCGSHQTYDLEVDHPDHQFYLANGVLTSNSHAVSYAIDSYYCAYLQTYYEVEWCCAYLESASSNADKLSRALKDIKSLGYNIESIDINHADATWTIGKNKTLMPSFKSCKGIGDSAIEEILENRPYNTIEELLWNEDGSWRHSKFNKKALENLIKIQAFKSLDCVGEGKLFKTYALMYEVIINNHDLIKKTIKKDPTIGKKNFYELIRKLQDDIPEWTTEEILENKNELLGTISVNDLISDEMIQYLQEREIPAIEYVLDLEEEEHKGMYWFVITGYTIKTTKNGKQYASINAVGMIGKSVNISVWGWNPNKSNIKRFGLYVAEIQKNKFGCSTTSWNLKEVNT